MKASSGAVLLLSILAVRDPRVYESKDGTCVQAQAIHSLGGWPLGRLPGHYHDRRSRQLGPIPYSLDWSPPKPRIPKPNDPIT
jgi:hypothetical protein